MKFFGLEKITKLAKATNDTVTLPAGSFIKIGGQGYRLTSALTIDRTVSGVGGLDIVVANSTLYYAYAVLSGGVAYLIGSTSASGPAGYSTFRKVGAFYTDSTGIIFNAYYLNEIIRLNYSVTVSSTGVVSNEDGNPILGNFTNANPRVGTFQSGLFSNIPYISGNANDGNDTAVNFTSVSTGGFAISSFNQAGALTQSRDVFVGIRKTGIDAIQPDWT